MQENDEASPAVDEFLTEQVRLFRIATDMKRNGLPFKAIQIDTGIKTSTLRGYVAGRFPLTMTAFRSLVGVIPNNLLSLLLPDGYQIVRVSEDIDHDVLDAACRDYTRAKADAHRPDSPAGRELSDCEIDALNILAAKVAAVAA